ncbi:MAG: hypothetical protein JW741_09670 [Sedimentisphaerales bacterium]|nr:hypothetical protein [Sedimentisphaerales bacterium]
MENKETEKTPKVSKSFLTVGPTLHYSHKNVQRCWLLAVVAFSIACLVWSRIATGTFWAFDLASQTVPDFWRLDQAAVTGASIFEYPWQIVVLGLLMGIMAVVPVLISQLMSFGHGFIFLLAVFFLANLPGFAIFLLLSCFAVAARPLRFRSRIIAIALCMSPQLIYWGVFGSARGVEPLEWSFSFAPWIGAWIVGLTVAGLVLGIGHYTRYRPGLIWIFTTTTLLLALGVFEWKIGFDELDYQFYVAKNNPEAVPEFRDHSIRDLLDQTVDIAVDPENDARDKQRVLSMLFAPTERIPLREMMKEQIQIKLRKGDWPSWLDVPAELLYQERRKGLEKQYDQFIRPPKPWWIPEVIQQEILVRRARSDRMPIALYYKGLLNEYSPDLRRFERDDLLHFYSDHPHERALGTWNRLYTVADYNDSPESIEARWRVAWHTAAQGGLPEPKLLAALDRAERILADANDMLAEQLTLYEEARPVSDRLFSAFRPPATTVMTAVRLTELQRRIHELRTLIGPQNRNGADGAVHRLARLVLLDPHGTEYEQQLETLLARTGEQDGLRDNILLAQAKLLDDEQGRGERLAELHRKFQKTDGGMQALYELTRLKIQLYQRKADKESLIKARDMLAGFLSLYPRSFYAEQVAKNLEDLPRPE